MKKIITALAALSALGLAAPAVAQDRYGNDRGYGQSNNYGGGIEARTDQLRQRLQIGIQRGAISRQEATYLRDGIRQVTQLERQYSRDGLNRNERRFLQNRLQQLQQQIHAAERNRDGRDWRDGRDDRNDGDGRWDHDRRDR
jgi:multidrug resistance efflux pump